MRVRVDYLNVQKSVCKFIRSDDFLIVFRALFTAVSQIEMSAREWTAAYAPTAAERLSLHRRSGHAPKQISSFPLPHLFGGVNICCAIKVYLSHSDVLEF